MLRAVKAVNKGLHYVAGALIIGVMVMTVYNILGRWLFDSPFRGTVELTELAMVGIVYLGLAYAQHRDHHISVDLLYQHLGLRSRAVLDAFATLLSMAVLALLAWQLYEFAEVLDAGNRTTASRAIPLSPVAYLAIVGVAAFMFAVVGTAIERIRNARRGDARETTRQASL